MKLNSAKIYLDSSKIYLNLRNRVIKFRNSGIDTFLILDKFLLTQNLITSLNFKVQLKDSFLLCSNQ